jgi:hypothetical protein
VDFFKKCKFCKSIKMGTMIEKVGIFLLLFFCFSCFSDNEKTHYIATQKGKNLQPYAKVIYKIFVDRGKWFIGLNLLVQKALNFIN